MAGGLPPPPTRAAAGDFVWTAWYNELYKLLTKTGGVSWAQVDKAGSSIADLQNKNHNLLTPIQGGNSTERYHLTALQYNQATSVLSKSSDPGTSDILTGTWALYKNTTTGDVKLWANDGGTMKSVALV